MLARHSPGWWALCLLHNWVAHPLLPLGDLLDCAGCRRAANLIYWLHDHSYPEGGG